MLPKCWAPSYPKGTSPNQSCITTISVSIDCISMFSSISILNNFRTIYLYILHTNGLICFMFRCLFVLSLLFHVFPHQKNSTKPNHHIIHHVHATHHHAVFNCLWLISDVRNQPRPVQPPNHLACCSISAQLNIFFLCFDIYLYLYLFLMLSFVSVCLSMYLDVLCVFYINYISIYIIFVRMCICGAFLRACECVAIAESSAQLGQGIRMGGGSVMPITGPGGLQQQHHPHHSTIDRRSSGSLRVRFFNLNN